MKKKGSIFWFSYITSNSVIRRTVWWLIDFEIDMLLGGCRRTYKRKYNHLISIHFHQCSLQAHRVATSFIDKNSHIFVTTTFVTDIIKESWRNIVFTLKPKSESSYHHIGVQQSYQMLYDTLSKVMKYDNYFRCHTILWVRLWNTMIISDSIRYFGKGHGGRRLFAASYDTLRKVVVYDDYSWRHTIFLKGLEIPLNTSKWPSETIILISYKLRLILVVCMAS